MVSLVFCYSGICSATDLIVDSTTEMSSHCDSVNHDASNSSDASQAYIEDIDITDSQNYECCFNGLTNSSIDDNLTSNDLVVVSLLDFHDILQTNNSKYSDLTFTHRTHDPPDIYISVSRFLL